MDNDKRSDVLMIIGVIVVILLIIAGFALVINKDNEARAEYSNNNTNSTEVNIDDILGNTGKETYEKLYRNEGDIISIENNIITVKVIDINNNESEVKIKVEQQTELLQENNDEGVNLEQFKVGDSIIYYITEENRFNPGDNGEMVVKKIILSSNTVYEE